MIEQITERVEAIRTGTPIECRHHGIHHEWGMVKRGAKVIRINCRRCTRVRINNYIVRMRASGMSFPGTIKKIEMFQDGKEITCKKHGSHREWRIYTMKSGWEDLRCKKCNRGRKEELPIRKTLAD